MFRPKINQTILISGASTALTKLITCSTSLKISVPLDFARLTKPFALLKRTRTACKSRIIQEFAVSLINNSINM